MSLICYDNNVMIRAFGRATFVHIGLQAKLDQEMNQMTLLSRHSGSYPGSLRSSALPLGHGGSPQYSVLRLNGEETFCYDNKNIMIAV